MGNTVYKYRLLDVWRIGENDSWLSDMAAEGLHLKSLGRMFARFERGQPRAMRYRMVFTDAAPDTQDKRHTLCAEGGWELACEREETAHMYLCVFRSPVDDGAPEIRALPANQAHTLKRLSRRLTLNGIAGTALYFLMLCLLVSALFYGNTPTLRFVEDALPALPVLAISCIFMIFHLHHTAFSTRRLARSLQEGAIIDHNADWRRPARISMVILLISTIFTAYFIAAPFIKIATRHTETLPLAADGYALIRLGDIERDPALERHISPIDSEVDWLNRVTREWFPLAPQKLTIDENGIIPGKTWPDGQDEYTPGLMCDVYTLRFASLAQPVLNDLRAKQSEYRVSPITENVERHDFDMLHVRSEPSYQEVFAAKGCIVIHLRYFGEKDMDTVLAAVAAYLERL